MEEEVPRGVKVFGSLIGAFIVLLFIIWLLPFYTVDLGGRSVRKSGSKSLRPFETGCSGGESTLMISIS